MKTRVIQTKQTKQASRRSGSPTSRLPRSRTWSGAVPCVSFFVLTYAVTWSLWTPLVVARDSLPGPIGFVLLVLGSLVPSTVAILLIARLHGRRGVRKLLGRLLKGRIGFAGTWPCFSCRCWCRWGSA